MELEVRIQAPPLMYVIWVLNIEKVALKWQQECRSF